MYRMYGMPRLHGQGLFPTILLHFLHPWRSCRGAAMCKMYGQDFSSRQILSTCIQVGNVVLQRSGCGFIVIPAKVGIQRFD